MCSGVSVQVGQLPSVSVGVGLLLVAQGANHKGEGASLVC